MIQANHRAQGAFGKWSTGALQGQKASEAPNKKKSASNEKAPRISKASDGHSLQKMLSGRSSGDAKAMLSSALGEKK